MSDSSVHNSAVSSKKEQTRATRMAQISNRTCVASFVVAVAMLCFMNHQQATSTPVDGRNCNKHLQQQQPAPEPIVASDSNDDDGLLMSIPHVADCAADEENHPGAHPSCEPTCANPNPVCIKIYYLDYVPCFCKAPLVRDTESKRCVQRSECPPKI